MGRLSLTGIGMATPVGIGREDIWRAVESGYSGIRKLTRFSFPQDMYCGEIDELDLSDYNIQGKQFRRAAPISQFALASTALALQEAGRLSVDGSNMALVAGITHGALGYTQKFHGELIAEGVDAISPIHFSDSILNAPAANASICFGIKGPVHTVIGGPEVAVKAMITACKLLSDGTVERAVIVCAEELNELSLAWYTRLGFSSLSEGGGAVVIENGEALAGSPPYCFIAGMASECDPSNPVAALESSIHRCLDMAGLQIGAVDLVMADDKTPVNLFLKGVPAGSIIPFVGNAFAASVLWAALLSAMAIKKDTIPHTLIRGTAVPEHINNVMVCTSDRYGSAAAILLSGQG